MAAVDPNLRVSEFKYKALFEASPIALWQEDFSKVKEYIGRLKGEGITDFAVYFGDHPEVIKKCASLVQIRDVNQAAVNLYAAKSKDELLSKGLDNIFNKESYTDFRDELLAFIYGKTQVETDFVNSTLDGKRLYLVLRWTIIPGYEEDWSEVIVSTIDITRRKEAEEDLKRKNDELYNLNKALVDRESEVANLKKEIEELKNKI
jgi:PAS domain-containing protein